MQPAPGAAHGAPEGPAFHEAEREEERAKGAAEEADHAEIAAERDKKKEAARRADEIDRLHHRHRQRESSRVGVADVFAGQDRHAAGDEQGVFPRRQHAGEPVDGRIRVAAAH